MPGPEPSVLIASIRESLQSHIVRLSIQKDDLNRSPAARSVAVAITEIETAEMWLARAIEQIAHAE